MNDNHLYYLHRSIHDLRLRSPPEGVLNHESNTLTTPTLFEYYCALQLSIQYNTPFTVWKDISPLSKSNYQVPNNDMGADCASSDFKQLVQVKYYGQDSTIGYGTLSTFIAFPKLLHPSRRDGIKLLLARTEHCTLTKEVRQLISYGDIVDHTFESNLFLEECQQISNNFIEVRMEQHIQLRPPQIEALKLIEQSDREQKNCILSIPTGVGKTRITLEYIRSCCTKKVLVFVPTLVLLDQWYKEALEFGLSENKVIRIGSGVVDNYNPNSVYSLVICVNNSVDKVRKHISSFQKTFVDEAHRIHLPHIYRDEELDITEDDVEEDCIEDEDTESDDDDEETYLTILKKVLYSQKNIVLLSATIDPFKEYLYYSYPIREAINQGYLCDYQLVCPIFNNCPNDSNIALYLIQRGECHCIVFCDSIQQADSFTKLLNSLLPNCARSIHSELTKTQRDLYIQEFEASQIRFLVNVRVLVEGFNCPIVSSCVFLHLPSNDTFAIQAIGRCLRLYPGKEIANIYLPFNRDEDGIDISRFITEIGKKDEVIRQACLSKTIGTYINLEVQREEKIVDEEDSKENEDNMEIEDENSVVELRFESIYNSLGQMDGSGVDRWIIRYNKILAFETTYHRLPSISSKDLEEKSMGKWISHQQHNYKQKKQSMKSEQLYGVWTDFRIKYNLLSMEELWFQSYHKILAFETTYKRLPSQSSKDPEEKSMGTWITTQQTNYNKKKQSMKSDKLYDVWTDFRIKYNLLSMEELWFQSYHKIVAFETTYKRLPSCHSKDPEEKSMGAWISQQQTNYNQKKNSMKSEQLYGVWTDFRFKYNLLSSEELWFQSYHKILAFETTYKRLPSQYSKDTEEKTMGSWINTQQKNYNQKKQSMKSDKLYDVWTNFRMKYNLLSLEELWFQSYHKILVFETTYKRLPSQHSTDPEEKVMGSWISQQQTNYNKKKHSMKSEQLYGVWTDFRFKYNLLSSEELWFQSYNKILAFETTYKRLPSCYSKDPEEKVMGSWINNQQTNYNQKKKSMKSEQLYGVWTDFRIKYNRDN